MASGSPPGGVSRGYVSREARELLPSTKLKELLKEVAPGELLDPDVEEFLQEHADEFVESVVDYACKFAKHRKSKTLEARDVQLFLERNWNMRVPGYGDDRRPLRKQAPSPMHAARLQAVAKAQQQNAAALAASGAVLPPGGGGAAGGGGSGGTAAASASTEVGVTGASKK